MGIYWAAVDRQSGTYFEAPGSFANKSPGIFHYLNPFPQMVVMRMELGYKLELENDCNMPCYYDLYENITDKVWKEFLDMYPEARSHYLEDKK